MALTLWTLRHRVLTWMSLKDSCPHIGVWEFGDKSLTQLKGLWEFGCETGGKIPPFVSHRSPLYVWSC